MKRAMQMPLINSRAVNRGWDREQLPSLQGELEMMNIERLAHCLACGEGFPKGNFLLVVVLPFPELISMVYVNTELC